MSAHYFPAVYRGNTWDEQVRISCDAQGYITAYQTQVVPTANDTRHRGILIPGFHNAHSHAFQYAMNGMTEYLSPAKPLDDFWAWRHAMYDLALRLDLQEMEAIASCLYAEMLRHGYTRVTEFHYLHHDRQGGPYADPSAASQCLVKAAAKAGIGLCLVPVFYQHANFGKAAMAEQRRFIFPDVASYLSLLNDLKRFIAQYAPEVVLGHGIHSLRACDERDAKTLLAPDLTGGPIHLHVAEQMREVQDCQAAWGLRPVEWLLKNVPLGPRHALVHATHMTDSEAEGLAASRTCVVLCPSTEGNLGDGVFNMPAYRRTGGRWAIGSDSHVGLFPCEELRWLDYQLRLATQKRNQLAGGGYTHSANYLIDSAFDGGTQATGARAAATAGMWWQKGQELQGIVIDDDHPLFYGKDWSERLAAFVYASDPSAIAEVLVKGRPLVAKGRHLHQEALRQGYRHAMASLRTRPSE